MTITKCEFCGRGCYLSADNLSCSGCGAPLPINDFVAVYDPKVIEGLYLGLPGMNVPVNVQSLQSSQPIWLSIVQGAASAGMAILG